MNAFEAFQSVSQKIETAMPQNMYQRPNTLGEEKKELMVSMYIFVLN